MFNMFFCGIRNGNKTYDEDRTLENFLDTEQNRTKQILFQTCT